MRLLWAVVACTALLLAFSWLTIGHASHMMTSAMTADAGGLTRSPMSSQGGSTRVDPGQPTPPNRSLARKNKDNQTYFAMGRTLPAVVLLHLATGANGEVGFLVSENKMDYSACETYCADFGLTIACIETAADQAALQAEIPEDCGSNGAWFGYNDADADGEWTWPAGCSSSLVYGEGCTASGTEPASGEDDCDNGADGCLTKPASGDGGNKGMCTEEQCCACSGDADLVATAFGDDVDDDDDDDDDDDAECATGTTGGLSYHVVDDTMGFDACETYCTSLGLTIACIETAADQAALQAEIPDSCGTNGPWFGYNDADGDGEWTWPAGCSSSLVYGEGCSISGTCASGTDPCDEDAGYGLTKSPSGDGANKGFPEENQCCACSGDAATVAAAADDGGLLVILLIVAALVIIGTIVGIVLCVKCCACCGGGASKQGDKV